MYLASVDPVLDEYEEITRRCSQNIVNMYNALPWWSKLNGRNWRAAQHGIRECWRLCMEATERRIREEIGRYE